MRRGRALPEQYKSGKAYFYESEFLVNEDVFIPRPETELLVETVVELAKRDMDHVLQKRLSILDLGTGSGNIAVSLIKCLPLSRITACDLSGNALGIARKNSLLNGVMHRIRFVVSDLFNGLCGEKYDMIASNPPYIAPFEFEGLPEEVLAEPRMALHGGTEGLYFIRRIIEECPGHLNENGYLVMEIGYDQFDAVREILADSKELDLAEMRKDYSGIDRMVVAKRHG